MVYTQKKLKNANLHLELSKGDKVKVTFPSHKSWYRLF